MEFKQGSPTAGTDAVDKSNGDFGTSRWQLDQQGTLASVSAKGGNGRFWHFCDITRRRRHVRFSNRPFGVKRFQTTHTTVSMSLAGSCFSSESAPRPFHHGIRRQGGTIFRAALPSN